MNIIDINGIQITSLQDVIDALTAGKKDIYGQEINVDQNTPDGQSINIDAQAIQDLKELIVQVYNTFDPDQAQGVNLDERAAINNIKRNGASYTFTDVSIVVDRAINLVGLDDTTEDTPADEISTDVYTIADNAGNQFVLKDSQTIASAGTYVVSFRAKDIGEISTVINTIVTPITILLGIISVNNPTSAEITGINGESDADLRIRRSASIALGSIGFIESMRSGLNNVTDLQDQLVLENITSSTDSDGIPPHSYWIIVLGGSDTDVAEVIYNKRSGGTNFKGSEIVNVPEVDGGEFTVKFDRAINEDLYIEFNVQNITGSTAIDEDFVKSEMVRLIKYKINQTANKTDIETIIKTEILPNSYIQDLQVSDDDITYVELLETSTKQHIFVLDVSRISITVI